MYQQNQPSLMSLLGTMVVFVVAAGYGIISLSTEDPLWFVPTYAGEASSVSLYCKGEEVVIPAGSQHLDELNGMLNQRLSGPKNWDSLTMSDDTYAYYQTSEAVIVLEFHYSEPMRVHSLYTYFSGFDAVVVPLHGRHSGVNAVFARIGENNTAGAMHVSATDPMLEYLVVNGLCAP